MKIYSESKAEAKALIAATADPIDKQLLSFAYSAMVGRLLHNQHKAASEELGIF